MGPSTPRLIAVHFYAGPRPGRASAPRRRSSSLETAARRRAERRGRHRRAWHGPPCARTVPRPGPASRGTARGSQGASSSRASGTAGSDGEVCTAGSPSCTHRGRDQGHQGARRRPSSCTTPARGPSPGWARSAAWPPTASTGAGRPPHGPSTHTIPPPRRGWWHPTPVGVGCQVGRWVFCARRRRPRARGGRGAHLGVVPDEVVEEVADADEPGHLGQLHRLRARRRRQAHLIKSRLPFFLFCVLVPPTPLADHASCRPRRVVSHHGGRGRGAVKQSRPAKALPFCWCVFVGFHASYSL